MVAFFPTVIKANEFFDGFSGQHTMNTMKVFAVNGNSRFKPANVQWRPVLEDRRGWAKGGSVESTEVEIIHRQKSMHQMMLVHVVVLRVEENGWWW